MELRNIEDVLCLVERLAAQLISAVQIALSSRGDVTLQSAPVFGFVILVRRSYNLPDLYAMFCTMNTDV